LVFLRFCSWYGFSTPLLIKLFGKQGLENNGRCARILHLA
jgi:hypothetical protein